ncbi:hypothetical protein MN608_05903 [Microdochium nivale]|nr:hypothetical protein MN608_05903 [Microdochium nivale]
MQRPVILTAGIAALDASLFPASCLLCSWSALGWQKQQGGTAGSCTVSEGCQALFFVLSEVSKDTTVCFFLSTVRCGARSPTVLHAAPSTSVFAVGLASLVPPKAAGLAV